VRYAHKEAGMTTRTTTSTRTRAVGYLRLSVEDRTGNGVSLEA
jgi:site-specific DNA recombinase